MREAISGVGLVRIRSEEMGNSVSGNCSLAPQWPATI